MNEAQILEERARLATEARGIITDARGKNRALDDSERERVDTCYTRLTELELMLADAKREAELDRIITESRARDYDHVDRTLHDAGERGKDPEKEYDRLFRKYLRSGVSLMSATEIQALQVGAVTDTEEQRIMTQVIAQLRDQGIATGAAGGFTVPQGFWARITETLKFFSVMSVLANNLDTDTGQTIPWPTNDDTGNEGEILGENVATTVLDLTFGTRSLGAFMFTSRMIRTSIQLLQDSGVDIEGLVARKAGQRIGRRLNRALTLGTGTGEPQGLITGIPAGQTLTPTAGTGWATTTFPAGAYKTFIDLVHKVDVAYRMGGQCRFLFHDLTLAAVMKLEDTQGRPLWLPAYPGSALQGDAPGTFLGYPYSINNFMASPGVSAKSVVFGDINAAYVVRNVRGGNMLRLSERYAEALQVAFLAFERHDGLVDDGSAVALLAQPAT